MVARLVRTDDIGSFSDRKILVFDKAGIGLPVCSINEPAVTIARTTWRGLIVEHFRLLAFDFPERESDADYVSVHLSSPTTLDWFISGKRRDRRLRTEEITRTDVPRALGSERDEVLQRGRVPGEVSRWRLCCVSRIARSNPDAGRNSSFVRAIRSGQARRPL